jgi:ectoine hydroxylase-related dioxygenase (phytanoyl-CoA dioxygenase family)
MDAIKQLNSAVPVRCEMPAGSIMLYRGSLLHGGGANRSTQSRLGILLEFIQAWLRPQETHLLGVDRDVIASLPVKLQEMLGWTVTPPFIGYVDGRHPKRLLSKV